MPKVLPIKNLAEALLVKAGEQKREAEIIKLITARVCFDHLKNNTCEHGYCFGLSDLLRTLEKENI